LNSQWLLARGTLTITTLICRSDREEPRFDPYGEQAMPQGRQFFSPDASLDSVTADLLSDAFEGAWQRVQTSGYRLARPGYADVMREVMAKHIVNLAEHGERDKSTLRESAFHFFTANYKA
jgi:hypothetical protein